MQSTTIAVDLAKSVFEVAVSHCPGVVAERHRLSRPRFARFLGEQAPATLVMEACGTAHFWARQAQACGHTVRLLPPRDVRPYVQRNKTDRADAKGLLEANRNADVEAQLEGIARASELVVRLRTIPGVGLLTATALVASIGDAKRFPSGRHFASSLGLTPREASSGNTRRLGRITKRGDPYLRTLLIHGGRSVLHHAKRTHEPDRLRAWAVDRERACGHNKAAVALANKLARTVWAVWTKQENYQSFPRRTDGNT
jgi:transposase